MKRTEMKREETTRKDKKRKEMKRDLKRDKKNVYRGTEQTRRVKGEGEGKQQNEVLGKASRAASTVLVEALSYALFGIKEGTYRSQ